MLEGIAAAGAHRTRAEQQRSDFGVKVAKLFGRLEAASQSAQRLVQRAAAAPTADDFAQLDGAAELLGQALARLEGGGA